MVIVMKIIKNFIPKNTPHNRRPGNITFKSRIIIHNTGNTKSTANNERSWLTNPDNKGTASYHYVVDQDNIIQCLPEEEVSWSAGDGRNGKGNLHGISIEICESGDHDKTMKNALWLICKILKERAWSVSKVTAHKEYSGKQCPRLILPYWGKFLESIEQELNQKNKQQDHWKLEALKELYEAGIINDYDGWSKKLEEPLPAWASFIIMNKIRKEK